MARATIEVRNSFRLKWFLNDEALLNPKWLEIGHFFCVVLVVDLYRPWKLSSAIKQVLFFCPESAFGLRRTCLNLLLK